jgi:PAT family beta-lactamase induction signal transducer AmpG
LLSRRIPAAWVLSLPFLTFGMAYGFVLVPLPQILAAQGVSGGRIAVVIAFVASPSFWNFVLAPLLDIRFRRRTYALIFGVVAVWTIAFTAAHHASLVEVWTVMFLGVVALFLYGSAIGGWMGGLIDKNENSRLGAWQAVSITVGNGIGILVAGYSLEKLSGVLAATVVFIVFLTPLLVFLVIPCPPPSNELVGKAFGRFVNEVAVLIKRREMLIAMALFTAPSASFALTNVIGGWGANFHASAPLVSLIGGIGNTAAIAGCLTVPILARKVALRPLYLGIGFVGAAFTLCLLLLPRGPVTYSLAFLGESTMQSAAFAAGFAVIYEIIGHENPLAATTFSLLTAAISFPISYMAIIDGWGYHLHGITGAFLADALVSGGTCVLLAIIFRRHLALRD